MQTYGKHTALSSMVMFGGVNINPQISALKKPLDILVATPGRLLDHCGQRTIDLSGVEILVLDEADRMLDMGFIRDIRKILALLPQKRQNLLFSATFSDEIRSLARGVLNNPGEVSVTPRNTATELVTQTVHLVEQHHKRDLISHIIRESGWHQVLVFTRTKHGANRLAEKLVKDGLTAAAIHGNKSQSARTRALAGFKEGTVTVLVATDIAARGLDIDQLPQVVNFELPNVPEDYVHRIGRTGRAGATGAAVSLVDNSEIKLLRDIERLIKKTIDRKPVEGWTPPATTAASFSARNATKTRASLAAASATAVAVIAAATVAIAVAMAAAAASSARPAPRRARPRPPRPAPARAGGDGRGHAPRDGERKPSDRPAHAGRNEAARSNRRTTAVPGRRAPGGQRRPSTARRGRAAKQVISADSPHPDSDPRTRAHHALIDLVDVFLASWAISFSPGAGAISAMSSGLKYGFARGYWNTAGLIMGILFQFVVVAVGLGAVLATSEMAFNVVKYLGVAYLIYLGVRQIRTDAAPVAVDAGDPRQASIRELVMRGFLINTMNPKGTVFLLAVVPQFVDPALPMVAQYAALAGTLAFTDLVAMGVYTLLAARVLRLLRDAKHIRWMNRTFGSLFILAGVFLASFRRHS